MIITETITVNGKELVRTYSNEGYYIERDGIKYCEAIDLPSFGYIYVETDELMETEEDIKLREGINNVLLK